jgi:hypothetical protein
MMKVTFFMLCISGVCASCAREEDNSMKISYGTSFNMCLGYCKNEMTMASGAVTYVHTSWVDSLKTINCMDNLDVNSWKYFESHLNINEFFELPKTIGCPDCADGGAEWIAVELANGRKHHVTFEYGEEPEMLTEYMIRLREQMSRAADCPH